MIRRLINKKDVSPQQTVCFIIDTLYRHNVISKKHEIRGYHKIKHFACRRDFFVHKIPRIKHKQNASYPGIIMDR